MVHSENSLVPIGGYEEHIKGDESLRAFNEALQEFDEDFCRNMFSGKDFTLKIEVHGNGGKLIHCRVHNDRFDRPTGDKKKSQ
jgi:hypothetical protein